MDHGEPNGLVALRRRALAAQREMQELAEVFRMAVQGAEAPESLGVDDVRPLCGAFLRHVEPAISTGRAPP